MNRNHVQTGKTLDDRCREILYWGTDRIVRILGDSDDEYARTIEATLRGHLDNHADADEAWSYVQLLLSARNEKSRQERRRRREVQFIHGAHSVSDGAEELLYRNEVRLESLLQKSIRRFATQDQRAVCLYHLKTRERATPRLSQKVRKSVSNANARLRLGMESALAGLPFIIAQHEPLSMDLLLNLHFAVRKPYRSEVMMCFDSHVLDVENDPNRRLSKNRIDDGMERAWKAAEEFLREAVKSPRRRAPGEDPRVGLAALIMLQAARWFGGRHAGTFLETYRFWSEKKLLNDWQLRRQFVSIGAYCGIEKYQMDFLKDDRSSKVELAAAARFVVGRRCGINGMSALVGSDADDMIGRINQFDPRAMTDVCMYANRYLARITEARQSLALMLLRWVQAAVQCGREIDPKVAVKLMKTLDGPTGEWMSRSRVERDFTKTRELLMRSC